MKWFYFIVFFAIYAFYSNYSVPEVITGVVIIVLIGLGMFFYNKGKEQNVILEIEEVSKKETSKVDTIPRTTQVNAKLSPELYKKFDGYCNFHGVTKTSVISEAITEYLDKKQNKQEDKENL